MAGKLAGRLATNMDGERRRRGVEELLGVVVGKDDPQVRIECPQPLADIRRERESGSKQMQFVSGVKSVTYWLVRRG